jgi:hypothetical protein
MRAQFFILAAAIFFLSRPLMTKESQAVAPEEKSGVSICLTTDKTAYAVGEPIRATIAVINRTSNELCLSFRDGQRFDFYIEREGKEVWRWSQGRMFAQVLGREVLAAGTSVTYSAKCEDKFEPGLYVVTGVIAAEPNPFIARTSIVLSIDQP